MLTLVLKQCNQLFYHMDLQHIECAILLYAWSLLHVVTVLLSQHIMMVVQTILQILMKETAYMTINKKFMTFGLEILK